MSFWSAIGKIYTPTGGSWVYNLYLGMFVGLIAAFVYGAFISPAALAAVIFLSGATLMAGVVLGFVFGIPRLLQSDAKTPPLSANDEAMRSRYLGNTNLEQISDWITKILVGVGLTQLTSMPDTLKRLGAFFAPSLGGGHEASAVAICVTAYFSLTGFMVGYLWTRLYLGGELARRDADQELRR